MISNTTLVERNSHSLTFLACCALALVAYGQPQATPAFADSIFTTPAAAPQVPAQYGRATSLAYQLPAPTIEAASAILVDAVTGEVLFESNADEVRAPASTTKIMTALLALESGLDRSLVQVSEAATLTGGSRLLISAGEQIPFRDMVEATMVRSGNDGASALAEAVAGTELAFIDRMNDRARTLGMSSTFFANPHGMPMTGGGNVSTARDLALLGRAAMTNAAFREIVTKAEVSYPVFGNRADVAFSSTNKLLGEFPLCTGIKTGYTNLAKHCLVASARFRDREVIGVILGAEKATIRRDMVRLFDFGLNTLADDYWVYRKFSLEPTVYPFEDNAPPAIQAAAASTF